MLNSTLDITNYNDAQHIFSSARMRKYLYACNQDPQRTMQLYAYNTHLSQAFFGVISINRGIKDRYIKKHKPESMLRQGLPCLTAAKVQQKKRTDQIFWQKSVIFHKKSA